MALPTSADVRAIVDTELTDAQINGVIADASLIAEKCLAGYSDDRQTAILKWLTAHLLASTDSGGVRTSEKLGDAQESFARATMGDSLKGTTYGQQVMLLDTTGCLSRLGRARSTIEVI